MMAQVKRMQAEMLKAQEELAQTVVAGSAGGGAVTVEMTCDSRVKSVRIAPDAVHPDDLEGLEALVAVAVNDALQRAADVSQKRMGSITGGLRIPGM